MKYLTILALPLLAAACAKGPGSIAPVAMGNAYAGISCQQASADLTAERETLAALESKQKGAVAGDAIGVLFIGVPIASLAGGDLSGDIAVSKGKTLALETRVQGCGK